MIQAAAVFTTSELAEMFSRPAWELRRALDCVEAVRGERLPRTARGRVRLVPAAWLPALRGELQRRDAIRERQTCGNKLETC